MSIDSLASPVERQRDFIRGRINYIRDLPGPNEGWWKPRDTDLDAEKTPSRLHARNLIARRAADNQDCFEYKTPAETHAAIQAELERRRLLPCGHTGISNRGNDTYTCGYEHCDAVHDRDVVEEVLQS